MTTWTAENTYRCGVFDVERSQEILLIREANDDTGVLTRYHDPIRHNGTTIDTYEVKCRSIVPIYGDSHMPQMLLCFGVEEQQ